MSGVFAAVALVAAPRPRHHRGFRPVPDLSRRPRSRPPRILPILQASQAGRISIDIDLARGGGLAWAGLACGPLADWTRSPATIRSGGGWSSGRLGARPSLLLGPTWNSPARSPPRRPVRRCLHWRWSLLAAGGIGYPSVAMALLVMPGPGPEPSRRSPVRAVAQIDGRARNRRRARLPLGCPDRGRISGAVVPGWRAEAEVDRGQEPSWPARNPPSRPLAMRTVRAIEADRYAVAPWLASGRSRIPLLEVARGRRAAQDLVDQGAAHSSTRRWRETSGTRTTSSSGSSRRPTPGRSWTSLPADAKPFEVLGLRTAIARATRHRGPPPSDLGPPAGRPGAGECRPRDVSPMRRPRRRSALRLDDRTPHADKKLPDAFRANLRRQARCLGRASQAAASDRTSVIWRARTLLNPEGRDATPRLRWNQTDPPRRPSTVPMGP